MPRIWKLGHNVNTDVIIPGRYNVTTDRASLAKHCLCEARPDFPVGVRPGDVVVGGDNFGCGSSREHAPVALQATGLGCVVARSFARIFYRNSINIGLPILICPELWEQAREGEAIEVDLASGQIRLPEQGLEFAVRPLPPFALAILKAGGIVNLVKERGDLDVAVG
ncbi:MAG: 3-isopropylmalate dehydratase small subunit [Chloroflexi bacterium]|nr:3-isopropylmalate dehydratase small subunit [Chloroflexota bacterium]MCL5109828.1 3-isopropylmalate dehydratase small subunit [Chloroflexota bacterium]